MHPRYLHQYWSVSFKQASFGVAGPEVARIIIYARRFDPGITALVKKVEYETSCSGRAGEDSDSASSIYSSPDAHIRSIPRDQLNDELRRWVEADDELIAEQKKNWVQRWLSGLY